MELLDGKKKLHLVNWDAISKPTDEGGLGFIKSFQRNDAFLGKLYWRMTQETNSPWAMLCNHKLNMRSNKSIISKCLKRGQSVFDMGLKYTIPSCLQTSLWNHRWLNNGTLRSLISGPLFSHESHLKVGYAFTESGNWNRDCFSFVFT